MNLCEICWKKMFGKMEIVPDPEKLFFDTGICSMCQSDKKDPNPHPVNTKKWIQYEMINPREVVCVELFFLYIGIGIDSDWVYEHLPRGISNDLSQSNCWKVWQEAGKKIKEFCKNK